MNVIIMLEKYVAELLMQSKHSIAFTGAGISVESGIPTFRGEGGLWEKYDPMECASISAFKKDPAKVWEFYSRRMHIIAKAKPNPAHLTLTKLERDGLLKYVITQNIDDLHEKAGTRKIVKLHGDIWTVKCLKCGFKERIEKPPKSIPPLCLKCGAILKPGVVMFEEACNGNTRDDWNIAIEECTKTDLMLIIGTSGLVVPAAALPNTVKMNGGRLVEINTAKSVLTAQADCFLAGRAGKLLTKIYGEIKLKRQQETGQ
jgi:NAD-dependent deacetylase